MERRNKPPQGFDPGCSWSRKGGGRCAPRGCDQGYIVEKIISNRRCETCFEGVITLCGLPAHLRPPLTLCSVEVIQVKPACAPHEGMCMPLPGCGCAPRGRDRVTIFLLCCVADSCGCRGEGVAQIEIDDCCGPLRPVERGANVRRGAQVELRSACFCAPCGFRVCMDICLHTVISCCEMVGTRPRDCCECPQLPLYPPPHHPGCC